MTKENISVVFIGTYRESEILSGPEKVCKRIFEEYTKIQETMFIGYFQDGRKYNYLKKLFGYEEVASVNGSKVLILGVISMLYSLIKSQPSVIHILCFNRFVIFLYLLKMFYKVNILYTLNGIIKHENKYYNKEPYFSVLKNIIVENVIIYFSDRIFYLSEFSKYILNKYYSPNKCKMSKSLNGLDDCFIMQNNAGFLEKEPGSLLFIGNIDQIEKGFDKLFAALENSGLKYKLYIIDSYEKIKRFNTINNVDVFITNKMTPKEMVRFMNNIQTLIVPSEYDTFNISALEAASCGLFPILTIQTGSSEIIENYYDCILYDSEDNDSLKLILGNVIPKHKQKLSKNSLLKLSWQNVLLEYYIPYYA